RELLDARRGERRLMREVTVLVHAAEWALAVRKACDQETAGHEQCRDLAQIRDERGLVPVLEHIECCDEVELPALRDERLECGRMRVETLRARKRDHVRVDLGARNIRTLRLRPREKSAVAEADLENAATLERDAVELGGVIARLALADREFAAPVLPRRIRVVKAAAVPARVVHGRDRQAGAEKCLRRPFQHSW